MSMLEAALARLTEFRRSWNEADVIDHDSGLTAADLDVILGQVHEVIEPEHRITFGARE